MAEGDWEIWKKFVLEKLENLEAMTKAILDTCHKQEVEREGRLVSLETKMKIVSAISALLTSAVTWGLIRMLMGGK